MDTTERHIVVSADGHCGADLRDYKPYLEKQWHDEFDSWADTYNDAWGAVDDENDEFRIGVASFASDVNWDSSKRTAHIEREGIAGEVLFPNTSPPFFPSGCISAYGPSNQREYELRFAGLQAHNRWLVEFCDDLKGRRAGIAQIFLNDVDGAVSEVEWAKSHGLKGVLLPSDHMLGLSNLYYPRYDAFWAACQDLNLPLHRHGVLPSEAPSEVSGDAPGVIGLMEAPFFTYRALVHLIISGVFDRFPGLKLVITENGAAGTIALLSQMDQFVHFFKAKGGIGEMFGRKAIGALQKLPSEYLHTNIYHGSFLNSADIEARHQIGIDRLMWGADYPHHEGTSPYTLQALRINFGGLPESETRSLIADTAIALYEFDRSVLQRAANQIGPTTAEINQPDALEEVPAAARVFCPTFDDQAFAFDPARTPSTDRSEPQPTPA